MANSKAQYNNKPECEIKSLTIVVHVPQVNCNDDKGVLLGRWTDDYDGGVSPLSWKGSVEILRNWDTNACQPVRFGQCWVFAAVACSG